VNWQEIADGFQQFCDDVQPYIDWTQANWLTIVLTAEIIGAVVAVKMGKLKRGIGWMVAAIVTIWAGGYGC